MNLTAYLHRHRRCIRSTYLMFEVIAVAVIVCFFTVKETTGYCPHEGIRAELRAELRNEVCAELREDLAEEVREELADELREEIRAELEAKSSNCNR